MSFNDVEPSESEGHYYEMEGLCDRAAEDAAEHSRARDIEAGIWRCKDVSAMTPDHLRNALAMLEAELVRRGEEVPRG